MLNQEILEQNKDLIKKNQALAKTIDKLPKLPNTTAEDQRYDEDTRDPMEVLSNAEKDFKENEMYFSTNNNKFKDMMENYDDSDCFQQALQLYSKDLNMMKERLKITANRTKNICSSEIEKAETNKKKVDDSDMSSQMSDYNSSVNGMTNRLEQLEQLAFRNAESRFTRYQNVRRDEVSLLENEIKELRNQINPKSETSTSAYSSAGGAKNGNNESTAVRFLKSIVLAVLI